jgi:hypothetical protein
MPFRRSVVVAALLVAVACDPHIEGHVEPGSRGDSVVIHAFRYPDSASGGRSVFSLLVGGCDTLAARRVFWRVEHSNRGEAHDGAYLRYGAALGHGWVTTYEPDPLTPGCYLLDVRGGGIGGSQWFTIDSAGAVRTFDYNPLY